MDLITFLSWPRGSQSIRLCLYLRLEGQKGSPAWLAQSKCTPGQPGKKLIRIFCLVSMEHFIQQKLLKYFVQSEITIKRHLKMLNILVPCKDITTPIQQGTKIIYNKSHYTVFRMQLRLSKQPQTIPAKSQLATRRYLQNHSVELSTSRRYRGVSKRQPQDHEFPSYIIRGLANLSWVARWTANP